MLPKITKDILLTINIHIIEIFMVNKLLIIHSAIA